MVVTETGYKSLDISSENSGVYAFLQTESYSGELAGVVNYLSDSSEQQGSFYFV